MLHPIPPKSRVLFSAILILMAAGLASAQSNSGRPLAIDDYYRIQDVGRVILSPDGNWVVYRLQTRIEADNSSRSEIYLVPSDASQSPRRVLHYGRDVENPSFSSDGWLQYFADGSWKIDPGSPSQVPVALSRQASQGELDPTGRWLATLKDKEEFEQKPGHVSDFEHRHEQRFQGVIFDWKDFQRDGQPFPAPNRTALPASQILLQDLSDGTTRTLVSEDLRPQNLTWHPTGQLLLFIADSAWRDELSYERPDLWTVNLSGKITRLTDDLYTYRNAEFSPDGRYLSYLRSFGTDMVIEQKLDHGGPRDLFVQLVTDGQPVNLTANWDLEPGTPHWAPDGSHIYFTATTGGEVQLFRVSVPTGTVEQVTDGERRLMDVVFDSALEKMAYTVGRHEAPPEVYISNIDGSEERRLTSIHQAITSEVTFSRAERLSWPSHDGTRIEGWLMFPHGYDEAAGPYPMIVFSHGGPHSATGYRFDFKQQYFAANGYFVLDTNFRSSTGYGEDFKWATWGAWGDKDGQDVVSGVEFVLERFPIDPGRVGHTGHSYGGFMTNWLITQYPDRFAAAITGAGISNWVSDYGTADIYRTKETEFYGPPWDEAARNRMIRQSPLTYAGRVKTPTLFVHGEVDQRVPYEEGEQMYFALKRRGVPAKMIQYADQPHGIRGHWNIVHRMLSELHWWDRYLKEGGTTDAVSQGSRP